MLGKPKYKKGDHLKFKIADEIHTGVVFIVDAYGTFFQDEEPSYDLENTDENILYKHIRESLIIEKL